MAKKKISIKAFIDENGKIKQLPVPNRTKIPLLKYLAEKFEKGRSYNEKEVNEIIGNWHTFNDYFVLRRALIDYEMMKRTVDGSKYWLDKNEEE